LHSTGKPLCIDQEAVAPSRECFDISGTIGRVAERSPENTHGNIDAVSEIDDGVVRPKLSFDFIAGYDLAPTLDQDSQDLEWLFSKENPLGTVRRVRWVQLTRADIQFKLSKSDTVGGQMFRGFWENGHDPIDGVDCATARMRGQHQIEKLQLLRDLETPLMLLDR
jgi:hypothetical protein